MTFEDQLAAIRTRLEAGAYPNEAAVSLSILLPVLRALGWDDSDPLQVMPEYAQAGRRVDFALCGHPGRPSVFIEVKGVGRSLEGDRQLFEYAFHEGIPLCVLTDGREWSFYLPGGQGSYEERRLFRLQLPDRPTTESARILTRYLGRERIRSGDALEDAIRDYRDLAASRQAAKSIPAAWSRLVTAPEDLLVELVAEEAEKLSGARPSSAEVVLFLQGLNVRGAPPAQVVVKGPAQLAQPATQSPQVSITHRSGELTYSVLGVSKTARNASEALVDILTTLAKHAPEKLPAAARAARGRSRNHIAQTVAEIYPARPDLARAIEFSPGWLVGLNISNREKIRIIREVCRAMSLRFGADVIIDLPNTD